MIISTASRTVFVAPTSGRARFTRAAAYREEARARFSSTCDCAEIGEACRYHDAARWRRTGSGQSRNGHVIARWACMLAALDGHYIKPPEPLGKPHAPPSSYDGLPF